jgi:MFS family permease
LCFDRGVDRDALSVVPEAAPSVAPDQSALAAAAPSTKLAAFRALRSTPFRLYFGGQVASASGTFLQQTAIGWLVLQLTGSASSLGLVLAAGGLPSLVLGPWGGAIADRFELRRLLLVTQALFGLLALALWICAASGLSSVGLIIGINVAGGFVSIVDSPARQAFVSSLVPAADLASAVSLNGVVMNSARVVGPAVAGALIVTVGTTSCFAVNAVSYLAVIAALLAIRPFGASRPSSKRTGGVRAGLQYARGRQQLWLPLVMMLIVGLLAFNFAVVLPVFARQTFHGSGGTYGLMSTMLSIGSVIGSLAVGLIHHPRRVYLVGAAFAFGIFLAATAATPNVALADIALLFTGIAAFCFVTLCSTTLQLHASPSYRGRILALWVFVYLGTTPIGSVLTGAIISASNARVALLVGAGACFVAAAIGARVRTPPDPDAQLTDLA